MCWRISGSPAGRRPPGRAAYHLRPDPAALGFREVAAPPSRGTGDRAAGARAGHVQVVEGRAARRLRGLQPERQGPHGRLRLFHPPGPRRPGIRAADLGGMPSCDPRTTPSARSRHGSQRSATRGRRWTRRRVAGRAARAGGQGRGGGPRAPVAAALRQADWEAPRVQPSRRRSAGAGAAPAPPSPGKTSGPAGRRPSTKPLIEIARAANKDEAIAGLERWKAQHSRNGRSSTADVLTDSMRGRNSTWYRIRVNLEHVPETDGLRKDPSRSTTTRGQGSSLSAARPPKVAGVAAGAGGC